MTADELISRTKITYTPESLMFGSPSAIGPEGGGRADRRDGRSVRKVAPQMDQAGRGWAAGPSAIATVVERPTVPSDPFRPCCDRNLAQGWSRVCFWASPLALVRNATDRTVRTREALDRISGVPTLATLPKEAARVADSPVFDEAVRSLRTRLLAQAGSEPAIRVGDQSDHR